MSTPEDRGPFSAELVPFPVNDRLPGVPAPTEMRDLITEQFNRAVARERAQRGEVHAEEDVWPMVRAVEGFRDLMGSYSRAFTTVADTAKDVLEEELFEVVPEQNGIPMGRLSVPAADGSGSTIRVKAKTENAHDIDATQVVGALAALVSEEWAVDQNQPDPTEAPEEFAIAVALRALEMVGASKLKVTHVRALAERLGHLGADRLAGVVKDAISTRKVYKGVDVDRKAG